MSWGNKEKDVKDGKDGKDKEHDKSGDWNLDTPYLFFKGPRVIKSNISKLEFSFDKETITFECSKKPGNP